MTSTISVLLIDDNRDVVLLVREALKRSPMAITFRHAVQLSIGLESLSHDEADLVLLDLSLPDSDGLNSLHAVVRAFPDTPVVVLTGLDDDTVALKAIEEGAQDYLVKGRINTSALVRVIRYAIERNRLLSSLRRLDQVRSEIVATVSHELRTPLTVIREYVALLRDGVQGPINDEQGESLDAVLRNCDRLGLLVDEVLDMASVESGRIRLSRRKTDLGLLLTQCLEDFGPRCAARKQRILLDLPTALPEVICDPNRTLQVIVNLLANAVKFTPEGGTIRIEASAAAELVAVTVADSGIGIAAENQAAVFDAFTQVKASGGVGPGGVGLGLAIVQHLVRLQGGTITLSSEPGVGSRFTFTLPAYVDGAEVGAFLEDRWRLAGTKGRAGSMVWLRVVANECDPKASDPIYQLLFQHARGVFRQRGDDVLMAESVSAVLVFFEGASANVGVALDRLQAALTPSVAGAIEYLVSDLRHWSTPPQMELLGRGTFLPLIDPTRKRTARGNVDG